jgi:uncharacterized membrane protein HdeD (DUF308 family)
MLGGGNVPIAAVLAVPAIGAAFSAIVRLLVLDKKPEQGGKWSVFAVGPDLMVAAVVAVPALLAGKNAVLIQTHGSKISEAVDPNWNPNGLLVLMIFFIFCIGVAIERWAKDARKRDGWIIPLFEGILPCALCGFTALGAALSLGAS